MALRVIDTDVWSYLYKGSNQTRLYEPHLFGNLLVISFQTQAELLRGALDATGDPLPRPMRGLPQPLSISGCLLSRTIEVISLGSTAWRSSRRAEAEERKLGV